MRQEIEAEREVQEPEAIERGGSGDGEKHGQKDRRQNRDGEDERLDLMAVARRMLVYRNLCRHVAHSLSTVRIPPHEGEV